MTAGPPGGPTSPSGTAPSRGGVALRCSGGFVVSHRCPPRSADGEVGGGVDRHLGRSDEDVIPQTVGANLDLVDVKLAELVLHLL